MKITQEAANIAADILRNTLKLSVYDGTNDRHLVHQVITALKGETITIEREVELPWCGVPGDIVVFTNKGGYDGERLRAAELLFEGRDYEIIETRIGRSSSTYRLKGHNKETGLFEVLGQGFNTVMFAFAYPEEILEEDENQREERDQAMRDSNEYSF